MSSTRKVVIAFIGSRGIPPRYGGAETFIYELGKRLQRKFSIIVTNESNKFGVDVYEGFIRVHIIAPHPATITIPVVYDIISTLYTLRKVRPHIIYYTAPDGAYAAAIAKLAGIRTVVNTDGIEWKRLLIRQKYAHLVHKIVYLLTSLLMFVGEYLSCKIADVTIADSVTIKHFLESRWRPRRTVYIAYGIRELPRVHQTEGERILKKLGLAPYQYYLTIGRIVAENNLHLPILAIKNMKTSRKLVIVGPYHPRDPYMRYLLRLSRDDKRIMFPGPIYDLRTLAALRALCKAYIHPYTVGGTNPSLLEQLQFDRPIIAYDVSFHREILGKKGLYFKSAEDLTNILEKIETGEINDNIPFEDVRKIFSWEVIAKKYESLFNELIDSDT
ncbi:DUF1972 domain-containing protein [Pyrobaculum sp.]|uniref:DUF1972 domain-containing protein n=1 Tax=Pyrobaculum sp. TaxID=2004705 RepID=UPI00315E95F4